MSSERLTWLVRRLSRMYWQEVPFRAHTVFRSMAQSRGLFDAHQVPALDVQGRFGQRWCFVPSAEPLAALLRTEADRLLDGDLWVFGQPVAAQGGVPNWNADPVTGVSIPLDFGLFIDFRHVGQGIDIKHLWELNRHLWWVRLAQAWAVTRDERYLRHLGVLLSSWMAACPYALGANWTSPVEHAIRLVNWSLCWHLIGGNSSPLFDGSAGRSLRDRWLRCIFQHMRFASDNYSFYSSADNHLIGEAAGVFVASHTWDCWAAGRDLRRRAKQILEDEACKQFSVDGVNLEQALCYHKFSLQFLLASGLCGRANGDDFSARFWQRIEAAINFQAAVTDVSGHVPKFGDSDDGDVWHLAVGAGSNSFHEVIAIGARLFPQGGLAAKCQALGRAVTAHADWVLVDAAADAAAAPASDALRLLPRVFQQGGYVLLGNRLHAPDELRVLLDCGALGYNRIAGHGHADALSVLVSVAGEELLVDAGTYCYNAAPALRHFFRGTAAHNTLQVDGQDQSVYGASFLWLRDVQTTVQAIDIAAGGRVHAHHDGYMRLPDPVAHNRRVSVDADDTVLVEDWLDCAGTHRVDLHWHCASGVLVSSAGEPGMWRIDGPTRSLLLTFEGAATEAVVVSGCADPVQGWVSPSFYVKHAAAVLVLSLELQPGQVLRTTMRPAERAAGGLPTASL